MPDRAQVSEPRDRGAVLVIVGAALVGLMTIAAIVVDLGLARSARSQTQSIVDLSALAAGGELAADPSPNIAAACADAVTYLRANANGAPSGLTVDCTLLPATCNTSTLPVTVTDAGTGGDYQVSITYPVTDASIADSRVVHASGLRVADGEQCERMRVDVTRSFDSVFAGIIGRSNLTARASAVVHQTPAVKNRPPNLWLLDPTGCDVLSVQGGSTVEVGSATIGGLITIDSDASTCTGNSFTIDAGGTGTQIRAIPNSTDPPGQIHLHAMDLGQATCVPGDPHACDPGDVSGGLITPQPIRRPERAGRAPIDHTYNCRSPLVGYPDYHGIPVAPCTGAPGTDYIDQLRLAVGPSGSAGGFQRWTDTYSCNNPTVPAPLLGNWWVDCSSFKLTSNAVVFAGGNVVFDGDIDMTGGALTFNTANPQLTLPASCLAIITGCHTQSSADAAWVYLRSGGDIQMTGGVLTAMATMIYLDSGYFSVAGGAPPVWQAPTEGPFSGLAVWAELSSNKFQINGGASMDLRGTFFTPEAKPMSISGGAPVNPQQAQFVSYRLAVSGGASLRLEPNLLNQISIPETTPILIR